MGRQRTELEAVHLGEWEREATLVEHLDCYSGALISGVFVAQLFEMFNKAL